jgi:hypothetical protein
MAPRSRSAQLGQKYLQLCYRGGEVIAEGHEILGLPRSDAKVKPAAAQLM